METYLLLKLSLVHRHGEPVVYTEIPDWLATLQTLIEWINVGFPTPTSDNLVFSWQGHDHCGEERTPVAD